MTIDQGPEMERYQGIVPLEGGNISEAADLYFRQSEQLPTFIKIAIARQYEAGKDNNPGSWSWRAGGLMVQKLTERGRARGTPMAMMRTTPGRGRSCLPRRSRTMSCSIPTLEPERLLYRLFHEERVRAFNATPISAFCQCSRERVEQMLLSFSAAGHRGHGRRRPGACHLRILQQRIWLRRRRTRSQGLARAIAAGAARAKFMRRAAKPTPKSDCAG